jgi:NAD(P)-dependent dehydrogenase (short-subunit alcohol dehydrogenase family)
MDLGERLRGRHVLITGASGGLGEHFARLSARCGAIVTVAARRRERLELLVQELSAAGAPAVTAAELDVSDESSVECFAAELHKADHPVDILVNNAGIAGTHGALDTPLEEFDRIIATNLRGVWLMSTALARYWREAKRPATIVNIASILGLRVAGGTTPYVVSKGGLVQMTKVLALEWARHGIRVNALAPGYIATDINAGFFESDAGREMIRRIPMRRLGRPEDLDGPYLLLATDASAWMTGSVIAVDGGHHVSSL